ncbi:MAG: TIGR01620 family protein [Silicimonas sp.]|nr:TIGR01620 family protein [Silicimonas sp.]
MTDTQNTPVMIELDASAPNPGEAPPIEDIHAPSGQAMQTMATLATRRPSTLGRWFWRLLISMILFFLSVSVWNFVTALVAQNPILGWIAIAILAIFSIVCMMIILKEWAALARLTRIDTLHREAEAVIADNDLAGARAFIKKLQALYAGRDNASWGSQKLGEAAAEAFDADTLLAHAEDTLMSPLDAQATREIEAAARQVATATALVPLAFADVLVALTTNLRMIRRICEIYGGRSGALGGWRLTRAVITHLVATGAVAVGDDLISSVGGGHLVSKISRRFGEGLVNGALTARVGIAAMEVCRPLPFSSGNKPRVTGVIRRALTGLFDRTPDETARAT